MNSQGLIVPDRTEVLRVKIEFLPYGEEADLEVLHTLLIANISRRMGHDISDPNGERLYEVRTPSGGSVRVKHRRDEGAAVLVMRALASAVRAGLSGDIFNYSIR